MSKNSDAPAGGHRHGALERRVRADSVARPGCVYCGASGRSLCDRCSAWQTIYLAHRVMRAALERAR